MPQSYPDTLSLSRTVLRVLKNLNLLMGFLILALLIASLVAEGPVMAALGVRRTSNGSALFMGMRLIMVIGIFAVPITQRVLGRLLVIVESVRLGSPFVTANAVRLQQIAWGILGLELLHVAVGVVAASVSSDANPLALRWSLSLTRWLAVLLLFVLARVFELGARMREDLEGTV